MRTKLLGLLTEIKQLTSPAEIRIATFSTVRIVLQYACISVLEGLIISKKLGILNIDSDLNFEKLRKPSDGDLLTSLSELLVTADMSGWNGISAPYLKEVVNNAHPCVKFSHSDKPTLEAILQGLVSFRNDVELGHGLPGDYDSVAEMDVLACIIEKLGNFLPAIKKNDALEILLSNNTPYVLKMLQTQNGDFICYRKILSLPSGQCRIFGQVQTSIKSKKDIVYEAPDLLSYKNKNFPQYEIIPTFDDNWCPIVLLPDRLTKDFVGRGEEIKGLLEWMNDTDSRACMLYGDGGYGKTTLVLEFIHKMIEGEIGGLNWRPEVITFFTAKQTRWGLNGLEFINNHFIKFTDLAIQMVKGIDPSQLDRSWYRVSDDQLIEKLVGFLESHKIDRKTHLIILDNTETMIKNEEELDDLANKIKQISRKVGRVIITSRRRERVEANQISMHPFSNSESEEFLRKRALALQRQQILQAGSARLNQLSKKMDNKPLVLEVFVQALGEPGISLERAFDRVIQMQRQDLGEFLYTDAWRRLSENVKHLLLLMTRLGEMHDEFLFKLCCLQVGVSIIEASDALEESKAIATLSRINDHLQIIFSPSFMNYCQGKVININGIDCPTQQSVDSVRSRYSEFLKSKSMKVYDRVSKAYIHPLARAAFKAFQEQRYDDCEMFYEQAVVADENNGLLYDRYAYFLFTVKRFQDAYDKSKVATQLLPNDSETWFTRGLIESRLEGLKSEVALTSLNKAQSYGKESHLCYLQKAYAYLNDTPPDKSLARAMLDSAEKNIPPDHPKAIKTKEEIRLTRIRIAQM